MAKDRFNHKSGGTQTSIRLPVENEALASAYFAEQAQKTRDMLEGVRKHNEVARKKFESDIKQFNSDGRLVKDEKRAMLIRALWDTGFDITEIAYGLGVAYNKVHYYCLRWKPPREAMTTDLWCPWPRQDETQVEKQKPKRARPPLTVIEKQERRLAKLEAKQVKEALAWPEIVWPDAV